MKQQTTSERKTQNGQICVMEKQKQKKTFPENKNKHKGTKK